MDLIRRYLWKYRGTIAVGFVFVILTSVTSLLAPWILKYAVDDLGAGVTRSKLLVYAGLILLVAVVQGVFRFQMRWILIGASRKMEYEIRMDIFSHLQRLPLAFFQENRTGDIVTRASSDVDNLRLFLGPGVMNLLNTVVIFGAGIVFMSSLSPRLTLYAMLPLPAAAILMSQASALYYRRYRAAQESNSHMSNAAQENFAGMRVVKAYVQEEGQIEGYRERNEDYLAKNLRLARLMGFFHPMVGFIVGLTAIIVLWAGGGMVIRGEISLGDLVAFLGFMTLLVFPTIALGWVINLAQRGSASATRISWLLNTEPSIRDAESPEHVERLKGGITVNGLTFSYPGSREPALKDVSLDIRPGQTVAVVGRTGSGKSTLVSLIPRLWAVPDGTIRLDGVDVNRLPLAQVRGSVGFVPQETFLFSDTLERNIALAAPPDAAPVRQAAELAGMAADLDVFPDGLCTLVGERGITLSGGQKQRTALARAILRDPRILILDDALSSVDADTERLVLDNLAGIMEGRTTIVITHRLSSITGVDLIVVLEDGRVVEQGRHQELLAAGGHYSAMYRRQQIIAELEREGEAS